jgi:predicted phage-related endonuclease
MGLSKYKSPFMAACEKLGKVAPFAGNDATRRGQRREPWLRAIFADWYREQTGTKAVAFTSPAMYRSKSCPFMIANLDGFVYLEGEGKLGVLEIKTASEFMRGQW